MATNGRHMRTRCKQHNINEAACPDKPSFLLTRAPKQRPDRKVNDKQN